MKLSQSLYKEKSFSQVMYELKSLSKDDEFLSSVISHIPQSITNNGIISIENLYQRFQDIIKVGEIYSHTPVESGFGGQMLGRIVNYMLIDPSEDDPRIQTSNTPNAVFIRANQALLMYIYFIFINIVEILMKQLEKLNHYLLELKR